MTSTEDAAKPREYPERVSTGLKSSTKELPAMPRQHFDCEPEVLALDLTADGDVLDDECVRCGTYVALDPAELTEATPNGLGEEVDID